jgi:hypothetical protein
MRHILLSYAVLQRRPDTSLSRIRMRRYRGLLRLSGAFSRHQFSAAYTISIFEFDFRQGHPAGMDFCVLVKL